jgi:sulfate/thiosulfate transport system permease protein
MVGFSYRNRAGKLPGFGLTLGYTLFWLSAIVLLPLLSLIVKPADMGWPAFWRLATDKRVVSAIGLSLGSALIAAAIDAVFGLIVAWVLTRYRFPARRLLDAMIDLPFALPTAVAGIALAALYAPNGWIGAPLAKLGIKLAFTPAGIVIALIFIGIPFVVRTVQPVLQDLDRDVEEAAVTLGAPRIRIVFSVLLPLVLPALLTGFALAFARAIGEYGSVIFTAGNMPMFSEIAPLLIVIKLEEFDYQGAAVIGVTMLGLSFILLLAINLLQRWSRSWQQ